MARRFYLLAVVLVGLGTMGFLSRGPIAGIFDVSTTLNVIHIATGFVAAAAAMRGLRTMRGWGQALGYLFAALALFAAVADSDASRNLLPLTNSNAWFHLVVSLVFLYHALLAPPTL